MVFEGALHEVEVYELVPKHPNLMQSTALHTTALTSTAKRGRQNLPSHKDRFGL